MSKLILLVGASCSGKSTFARQLQLNSCYNIVISSDNLREIINGDQSSQENGHIIFKTMENMCEYFLKFTQYNVVIDATNLNRKSRKNFLRIARNLNKSTVAYIFKVTIDELFARQKKRERKVPYDVILRQFDSLVLPIEEEVDCLVEVENITDCGETFYSQKVIFQKE